MVSRLVPFAVLLLLAAALPATDLPAGAYAGDESLGAMPAPERVAGWILSTDEADLERAVSVLRGAPPAYLEAVVRCVRAGRGEAAQPAVAVPAYAPRTVRLEARMFSGRRGLATRLLGEGRMRGSHLLTASEADALTGTLTTREDTQVVHAPSLVVTDGEWGTVALTTPFSYVKFFDVQTHGGDTIKNPVVDVVEEGLVFEVRPRVAKDGQAITLAGSLTHTAIDRPIPTQVVNGDEVPCPVIQTVRLNLHFTAPDGGTIVCTGLRHPTDAERELIVLLRVRRVTSPEPLTPRDPAPGTRVVTLEVRLLRTAPGVLDEILGGASPCPDEPLRGLEAKDVVRLLGPGRGGAPGVEVLIAPTLTTFDGRQANVSMLNQTTYVRDYTVEKADGVVILDPVVDILQDGLVFDVTPTITADRTRIGLETVTTWAVLTRPIADFTTSIEGQEVTIQIPELKVSRIANDFELAAGGYVLIGGFDDDAQGRATSVLLHASVTDLDEEELRLFGR